MVEVDKNSALRWLLSGYIHSQNSKNAYFVNFFVEEFYLRNIKYVHLKSKNQQNKLYYYRWIQVMVKGLVKILILGSPKKC